MTTQLSIEPHRHDVDGLWYVKVKSEGDPTLLMSVGSATKLVVPLRAVGAEDLADDFEREVDRTRRFAFFRMDFSSPERREIKTARVLDFGRDFDCAVTYGDARNACGGVSSSRCRRRLRHLG
jgi:hypothetical protein